MKRVLILAWLFTGLALAKAPFLEGKHYQRLSPLIAQDKLVQLNSAPDQIHVIEFFSYACTWCYKLEPYIERWRQSLGDQIVFQRVPVEFQPNWRLLTKAYYMQNDLKVLDKLHLPLFEAIQTEKITRLSEKTLQDFFVAQGVDRAAFTQAYHSFEVENKQRWAESIARAYRIVAIPVVVVQGSHEGFISSIRMAGSEEQLITVMNYLIDLQKGK